MNDFSVLIVCICGFKSRRCELALSPDDRHVGGLADEMHFVLLGSMNLKERLIRPGA